MRNFAYGYTDRNFGPARSTAGRPAPPLLYHKPQALSIGNLHKKRELFSSLSRFGLLCKQFEIVYHRLHKRRGQQVQEFHPLRGHSIRNLRFHNKDIQFSFLFLLRFIIVFARGGPVGVCVADFHFLIVVPVVARTFNTAHFIHPQIISSNLMRYSSFHILMISCSNSGFS